MKLLERRKRISPLSRASGTADFIFRDVRPHAVDQGVGADLLGNISVMLVNNLIGTEAERVHLLWVLIHRYYDVFHVSDRPKNLT